MLTMGPDDNVLIQKLIDPDNEDLLSSYWSDELLRMRSSESLHSDQFNSNELLNRFQLQKRLHIY